VENTLVKDGTFALPGKKKFKRKSASIQYVVIDMTESPIKRPKKDQKAYYSGKKRHTLKTQVIIERSTLQIIDIQEAKGTEHDFKGDNLPVENVSWYDGIAYCNRRSVKEGLTSAYTIDKTRSDGNNARGSDNVKWVVAWRNRSPDGYRLPTEAVV
jgi:hypothetical protein